jgi:hypothetical protein
LILTLTLYRLKHPPACFGCLNVLLFFLAFSYLAILLSLHLADLLSTDRRWRDGIKTRWQTARQKGDGLAGVAQP